MLKAAIIGLGQVGSRFDEEPRKAIWSHAGAYLSLKEIFSLVAGVDLEVQNQEKFRTRCPLAKVYEDAVEMMTKHKPDVVSICTPPHGRARLVEKIVNAVPPSVLICEKPLERDPSERSQLLHVCKKANVGLFVNYNRRYSQLYNYAKLVMQSGSLGDILSVTVCAPNRLWSVGSHAINLLLYLVGEYPEVWHSISLPRLYEDGEPAVDFICRFPSGTAGRVLTTGFREALIFDVDLIGSNARLSIQSNGTQVFLRRFKKSLEYVGYSVEQDPELLYTVDEKESTFIEILARAADWVMNKKSAVLLDGVDALTSENLLDELMKAERNGHEE
ncbi:MAG: hypothetical protein NPIRA02_16340 [Nitrospirales bacterium]|nr:MAG: hypothetical protein NPIRA02_16340 [Nitrospirales bacterium]